MSSIPCFQSRVLNAEQSNVLKRAIESFPREDFFFERANERWGLSRKQPSSHRFVNPFDSWFDVVYDLNAEVVNEQVTLPFSDCRNIDIIQKTVHVALKWMAEQMKWHGTTRQMALSIMQHYALRSGQQTSAIPWHRDNSDHTLVILIDDESKWEGGDFLFQVGESAPLRFQPKQGFGVLFKNDGTKHTVESLTSKENDVNRTILTLHEKQLIPKKPENSVFDGVGSHCL